MRNELAGLAESLFVIRSPEALRRRAEQKMIDHANAHRCQPGADCKMCHHHLPQYREHVRGKQLWCHHRKDRPEDGRCVLFVADKKLAEEQESLVEQIRKENAEKKRLNFLKRQPRTNHDKIGLMIKGPQ